MNVLASNLSEKQIRALVLISLDPTYFPEASSLNALKSLGLVRYTTGEFIFSCMGGGSTNSGYVLTDVGEKVVDAYRMPTSADLLAALESVPREHRTDEVSSALRRLRLWGSCNDSLPAWTKRPTA